jgi:hypothetical protein
MQNRKHESPHRREYSRDRRCSAVEVVDVREAEAAGHRVERFTFEAGWRSDVAVDIRDTQPLTCFSRPGHVQQHAQQIVADHACAPPRQLSGDPPVTTGDIEDAHTLEVPQQIEYRHCDRVAIAVWPACLIQLGNLVVAGLDHVHDDRPCIRQRAILLRAAVRLKWCTALASGSMSSVSMHTPFQGKRPSASRSIGSRSPALSRTKGWHPWRDAPRMRRGPAWNPTECRDHSAVPRLPQSTRRSWRCSPT